MITKLNDKNFQKEIKNGVKLIEFHTKWCGFCKKQQPELEAMNKVWIGQIDADEVPSVTAKFNINSFPTFIVMKNGEEVERFSGMQKKEYLMTRIMKHFG